MKARWIGFRSQMAQNIESYLAHKRALGARFLSEERELRLFDRFLIERGVSSADDIGAHLLEAFLASRPRASARSHNHLLGVIKRLFTWLIAQGSITTSPLRSRPRRETARRIPFLFDAQRARRLLEVAATLPDKGGSCLRGPTYRTVFALLYGLGLRVGEVARLRVGDIDLDRQLLLIRDTKFSKSRLVPFGTRMGSLLREFVELRAARKGPLPGEESLFSFHRNAAVNPASISMAFHSLLPRLNLEIPAGVSAPRVHDLRHSFAVGTLLRWYRQGLDPAERLLHLSTFLGHVNPASTAVYLTITAELLEEASRRFERAAGTALSGVARNSDQQLEAEGRIGPTR